MSLSKPKEKNKIEKLFHFAMQKFILNKKQCLQKHNTINNQKMAGVEGFEPSARGFGDRCSTN